MREKGAERAEQRETVMKGDDFVNGSHRRHHVITMTFQFVTISFSTTPQHFNSEFLFVFFTVFLLSFIIFLPL